MKKKLKKDVDKTNIPNQHYWQEVVKSAIKTTIYGQQKCLSKKVLSPEMFSI